MSSQQPIPLWRFWELAKRFDGRSWPERIRSIAGRCALTFPGFPVPIRLPAGVWWLARNDTISDRIVDGCFETAEYEFMNRWLRRGMTVLDIGANQGYYTLLAARKVGPKGIVLAFEPSTRERKRLSLHLRINLYSHVHIESAALGDQSGEATLYVVNQRETGCNSLRPPDTPCPTHPERVTKRTLDEVLRAWKISRVDFIKMDVEGAELSVLRGARQMLQKAPRPVFLVEIYNVRSFPWGYAAREIVGHLAALQYRWFRPLQDGSLEAVSSSLERYDGNFAAVPEEILPQIWGMFFPESGARGWH